MPMTCPKNGIHPIIRIVIFRTTNSVRKPNEIGNRNPTLPQSKSIRLNIFAIFPQRKVET